MAHIFRRGIAETTTSSGTNDIVPGGRVYGALAAFFDVMAIGDTCDYVIRYGDTREEGIATRLVSGVLERTSVSYARHANGDVNQTKVSFPAGIKHVYMTVRADRVAAFLDALRPQSFSQAQRDQACENLGLPKSGNKIIIPEATAWVGWTKDTTHHNKAIRIVNDASGGSAGGSVDFCTLFGRTATDNFTIGQSNLPNVSRPVTLSGILSVLSNSAQAVSPNVGVAPQGSAPGTGGNTVYIAATFSGCAVDISGGAGSCQLGSGTVLSAAIDMRVKHVNSIIQVKD